jgi:hypothetical protein
MSTPGAVLLERNDPKFQKYLDEVKLPKDWHFFVVPEDFETHVPCQGKAVRAWIAQNQEYWKECKWIGLLNDDFEPISQDWDIRLIGKLNSYNLVSGNDRWKAPERITAAPVWSGDLLRAVGYLFPQNFSHFFFDDVWEMLSVEVPEIWDTQMDIIVLHNHVMVHKTPDSTSKYIEYESGFFDKDKAQFIKWLDDDFKQAALRIMSLLRTKKLTNAFRGED